MRAAGRVDEKARVEGPKRVVSCDGLCQPWAWWWHAQKILTRRASCVWRIRRQLMVAMMVERRGGLGCFPSPEVGRPWPWRYLCDKLELASCSLAR